MDATGDLKASFHSRTRPLHAVPKGITDTGSHHISRGVRPSMCLRTVHFGSVRLGSALDLGWETWWQRGNGGAEQSKEPKLDTRLPFLSAKLPLCQGCLVLHGVVAIVASFAWLIARPMAPGHVSCVRLMLMATHCCRPVTRSTRTPPAPLPLWPLIDPLRTRA